MKRLLIQALFLTFLVSGCASTESQSQPKSYEFYVGTYTQGPSEGIYKFSLTPKGELANLGLVATALNPSFLALAKDGKHLLAVNETDDKGQGYLQSYAISDEGLSLLSTRGTGGAHPCFVTVNANGQILTTNYTGGNVALHQLQADGQLSARLDLAQHQGSGVHWRQEKPHPHSIWFSPQQGEVIAVDLGANYLYFYELGGQDTKLTPKKRQPKLAMEAGAGPRFLAIHPTLPYLYVLNELSGTVSQIEKRNDGRRVIKETVKTLPEGFKGQNTSAHVELSPDGRFLYLSNRGHNSIAVVAVDEKSGRLTPLAFTSTQGKTPRNFALTPDGNLLLVANQDSNNLVVFKRDNDTGLLSYLSQAEAFSPTSLVFVK